jgi:hypothetical protein
MRDRPRLLLLVAGLTGCSDLTDLVKDVGEPDVGLLLDRDGDGVVDASDCAPEDPTVFPGAVEACNGVDDDCDGDVDEDAAWYPDGDGDGFGDAAGEPTLAACGEAPDGFVADATDCDDGDAAAHPGAAEACNGVDDDCDGTVDPPQDFHPDEDGDGYGDATALPTVADCADPPAGQVPNALDCDDTDPGVRPGGDERCDPLDRDEDCDGLADDADPSVSGAGAADWYLDGDGDGFGDPARRVFSCDPPAGHVGDDTDCDDDARAVNPAAAEICDARNTDEDCDGRADDLDPSVDPSGFSVFYEDADADGHGDPAAEVWACDLPVPGHARAATDCDDADATVHPGAAEVCDGVDQDCDGALDFTLDWVPDADGDGFGDAAATPTAVDCLVVPEGLLRDASDCDDADPDRHPGAPHPGLLSGVDDPACDGGGQDLGWADLALTAVGATDQAGFAVAGGGDVDGDGLSDLLIGARFDDDGGADAGAAFVVLGATAAGHGAAELSLGAADLVLVGEAAGDRAGSSLAFVGDVDGDGLSDLLIGAPTHGGGGAHAGKAYLVLGSTLAASPTGGIDLADADFAFVGGAAGDGAGAAVAGAGDVDGDGLADLIIGAAGHDGGGADAGQACLFFGASLLAGGAGERSLASADLCFTGEGAGHEAGISVAGAGDVDGDGLDDLLIGAWGSSRAGTEAGVGYLVLGASALSAGAAAVDLGEADLALLGEDRFDRAGGSVSAAGDVDGDGLGDVLIGAWGQDQGGSAAGMAYLLLGASLGAAGPGELDLSAADVAFVGEAAGDRAGDALAAAGDVDGDGLDDLLVGAPFSADGGADAGKAWLVRGATLPAVGGGLLDLSAADFAFIGEAAKDSAGSRLCGAGDVDGDGLADLLIGAYRSDRGAAGGGAAYLVFGVL